MVYSLGENFALGGWEGVRILLVEVIPRVESVESLVADRSVMKQRPASFHSLISGRSHTQCGHPFQAGQ